MVKKLLITLAAAPLAYCNSGGGGGAPAGVPIKGGGTFCTVLPDGTHSCHIDDSGMGPPIKRRH